VKPDEAQEVLGGSPGLFLFNTNQLPNRKFVALARQTARENRFPCRTNSLSFTEMTPRRFRKAMAAPDDNSARAHAIHAWA